jgi:NAD(P)-dependent dehydrogenase (short-subunit alcohol dehydrogenase family)
MEHCDKGVSNNFFLRWLTTYAKDKGNNSVTRGMASTSIDLDVISNLTPNMVRPYLPFDGRIVCYGCGKMCRALHADYVMCCFQCGELFRKMRTLSRDLTGYIAFVTGGRTKLGHQVVKKLLRAGAKVYATTRRPKEANDLFMLYEDSNVWCDRLRFFELDLNVSNLEEVLKSIRDKILENDDHIDLLINVAAQTIGLRDNAMYSLYPTNNKDMNRYGDMASGPSGRDNCWNKTLIDVNQSLMESVFRINAIAPALIIKTMFLLLKNSPINRPRIINTHAREGLFSVRKTPRHIHTNMGKAALHMLTLCLGREKIMTHAGVKIAIHGIDPGWISIDEYGMKERPFDVPPIDEIDGAARLLYPVFKSSTGFGSGKTVRHYYKYCI